MLSSDDEGIDYCGVERFRVGIGDLVGNIRVGFRLWPRCCFHDRVGLVGLLVWDGVV